MTDAIDAVKDADYKEIGEGISNVIDFGVEQTNKLMSLIPGYSTFKDWWWLILGVAVYFLFFTDAG